jgi:hypothetical protein
MDRSMGSYRFVKSRKTESSRGTIGVTGRGGIRILVQFRGRRHIVKYDLLKKSSAPGLKLAPSGSGG